MLTKSSKVHKKKFLYTLNTLINTLRKQYNYDIKILILTSLFSQALDWINDFLGKNVTYIMKMVIFFRAKYERIINMLIFF